MHTHSYLHKLVSIDTNSSLFGNYFIGSNVNEYTKSEQKLIRNHTGSDRRRLQNMILY